MPSVNRLRWWVLWFFDCWEKFVSALETYLIGGVLKTVHGNLSGSVVWPELAFACSTPDTSSLQCEVSWMNESTLMWSVGRSTDPIIAAAVFVLFHLLLLGYFRLFHATYLSKSTVLGAMLKHIHHSPNCEEMNLAVWSPLLLLCSTALTISPPALEITAGHQIVAGDLCPGVDRTSSSSFVTLNDAFAACLLACGQRSDKESYGFSWTS
ncbi:hypothetical protein T10_3193 [Trichinella papuae]|uniref:Uncharacterized protein n=1 Tax=Trichinella papuae TaxID=268474 RepID=A0A0V1MFN4_9BILA|nr:hypothetical protein T10_3193 [Trichinella papuae]